MPEKDPGVWQWLAALLSGFRSNLMYAGVAGLFVVMRTAYTRQNAGGRMLDALACSSLAWFSEPVVEALASATGVTARPVVFAIFIGYVGNDWLRGRLLRVLEKRGGGQDNESQ